MKVVLLAGGTMILGKGFGFKTIYCILCASFMFEVLPQIPWITGLSDIPDKFINALIGGGISAFGIAAIFMQGGSTGGTDIIALVWCRFYQASPGRVILIIDFIIIASSMLFPSYTDTGELLAFGDKLAVVIYGLIQVTVSGYAIDLYISGSKQSVQTFIFTKKTKEIADAIAYDMKKGVTAIPAKGWYTQEEREVLMVVIRKADLNLLLRYVKTIDPDAFISISNVSGVYGLGFDTIKQKRKG